MKRLNKFKGLYALLVVVTTMIGITIYESCSADEDYDDYSGQELSTRAEREMGKSREGQVDIGPKLWLSSGNDSCTIDNVVGIGSFSICMSFSWLNAFADNACAVTHSRIINHDTTVYKHLSCESGVVDAYRPSILYPDSTTIFKYCPRIRGEKYIYNSYGTLVEIKTIDNQDIEFSVNATGYTHWIFPSH